MPRIPRSYIKTCYFHVMIQGIDKSYIFEQAEDIKYYIKTMYELIKEHELEIVAYCIMNNHAHFLIKTEKLKEMSKYMQRLNTKYARHYNHKYNRVGYVFRDRYKSEGIYTERQLQNCIKYIFDNPVKAGMCEKASDYPYSNYKKQVEKFKKEYYEFIDIEEDINISKKIIDDFLKENKMQINELKADKEKLKHLVIILKEEYHISLRKVAKEINIDRETIRRIYGD